MPVKYIAEIRGGREVMLVGTADYDYWKCQLADEALVPVQTSSRAEILLSGVALKWMAVRFRELSVSVSVHEPDRPEKAGVFLAAAFNTSKLFSFVERNWFHTPYGHAAISVSVQEPWSFQLRQNGETILRGTRSGVVTPDALDTVYEGPIYLPSRHARGRRRPEVFFAKLAGETQIDPFDAERDSLQLAESAGHPILKMLIDSNFTGAQWRVRSNATHARSKTYKRSMSS